MESTVVYTLASGKVCRVKHMNRHQIKCGSSVVTVLFDVINVGCIHTLLLLVDDTEFLHSLVQSDT